jgi:uncharacterized RDD family membrane protein YckC
MTQQNETEQQPAAPEQAALAPEASQPAQAQHPAPSGPAYPSPYLDGGEAVPQAYLAPPQPGQPRFGTPSRAQAGRPFGGGQPRYGNPPAGRQVPGMAAAARRDPALATAWHRLAASTIDWFIIIALSLIAFWSPLSRMLRELSAVGTRYPGLASPAAQAAINSIGRNPANQRTVLYWILGMFGIALVYFWVQHAAWGATVGKRVLGVRVVRAADRSAVGVRQAGIRAAAFVAGPAAALLASAIAAIVGSGAVLLLLLSIEIAGYVLWVTDGCMVLRNPQAQSLHDRLAGTVVVRQRLPEARSRGSQSWWQPGS